MRSLGVILVLAPLLLGCGAGSVEMLFIKPGRFDYFSCGDIATATRAAVTREQELQELIEKAEQETFGAVVAAAAYRPQYLRNQGELKLLAQAAQNKNCAAAPKSEGPAPQ